MKTPLAAGSTWNLAASGGLFGDWLLHPDQRAGRRLVLREGESSARHQLDIACRVAGDCDVPEVLRGQREDQLEQAALVLCSLVGSLVVEVPRPVTRCVTDLPAKGDRLAITPI